MVEVATSAVVVASVTDGAGQQLGQRSVRGGAVPVDQMCGELLDVPGGSVFAAGLDAVENGYAVQHTDEARVSETVVFVDRSAGGSLGCQAYGHHDDSPVVVGASSSQP
jgi:hypothetical protein